MDEIALLRAIRPDAPEGFAEPERGEVLCRLLAAAAGERAAGKPVPTAGWLRRARWRWRLRVAGPPAMARRLGIAAAAAAADALAGLLPDDPQAAFRSAHLLDLHIEECHDAFLALKREKGEHTVRHSALFLLVPRLASALEY